MQNTSNTTSLTYSNTNSQVIAELLPIAALIVLVNSIVFVLFAKEQRLRKSPTNYLLFSLAVCDFMTGIINIPLSIIVMTQVSAAPDGIYLGFFVVILNNMVVVLVVYHVFAITAERYLSIARPFRHRQMTKKSSLKVILVIWLVAMLIAFLPVTWFRRFLNFEKDSAEMAFKIQAGHIVFCIVFVFLLPYIFIVYSQFVMFRKIKLGTLNVSVLEGGRRNSGVHGNGVKSLKRCLIIFALMAVVNLVCWFPWYILSFFNNRWFPISEKANMVLLQCSHAFLIIRYLASIANPVLYTFFKRDFYAAFKTIILRSRIQLSYNSSLPPITIRNCKLLGGVPPVTKNEKKELL